MKDLNVRPETIKILEENTGSHFFDIGHSNIFLNMSPEARKIKAKINCWDYIKIKKNFCTVEETTKVKGNLLNAIFAHDVSDKVLVSKICKEFIQLKKQIIQLKIRPRTWTFLQRRHIDGQQTHENMLNITHHQGNTNQDYNEVLSHTCQNN